MSGLFGSRRQSQSTSNQSETNISSQNVAIEDSTGAVVGGEGSTFNITDGGAIDAFERLGSEFLSEANTMYQNTLTFADAGLNESVGLARDVMNDVNQAYREGIASNAALATQVSRTPSENQNEMIFKFLIIGSIVMGLVMMFGGKK